ncbi:MAG: toprim domain-containing protein [Glaciimonas sp.]|nr:toprim domain-containing protein [Glaciimonas sp.]
MEHGRGYRACIGRRIFDKELNIGSAKVRFSYGASFWSHPRQCLQKVKELRIVKNIFDAITLEDHAIAAVSIMICSNYPLQLLENLRDARGDQKCRLVWALDGNADGRSFTAKHVKRAREAG